MTPAVFVIDVAAGSGAASVRFDPKRLRPLSTQSGHQGRTCRRITDESRHRSDAAPRTRARRSRDAPRQRAPDKPKPATKGD